MHVVKKWETEDKKLFDSETEARKHELETETFKELAQTLSHSCHTGRWESVLRHMIEEEETIRAILLRHHKRTPKMKAA